MSSLTEPHDRTACVICGGARITAVARFAAVHMVRCATCGTRFAGRAPSDSELDAHYRTYGEWPDSAITRKRYRELLAGFERYRGKGRIFDMGCGAGYFLEEAATLGWSPHGSNVGERSITMCRAKGLDVVSAPVVEGAFPDGHFDVATAFEVFEHLRDPAQEAQTLARLIRPGGLLYCTTPNYDSLSRRLLGSRWRVISYPEHLIYFTAASLSGWLERYGFRTLSVTSTGISLDDLRAAAIRGSRGPAGSSHGTAAGSGREEWLRAATETGRLMPSVKGAFNRGLSATQTGDTLKGLFIRTSDP
jgi:SAM-dependent methyltransferase